MTSADARLLLGAGVLDRAQCKLAPALALPQRTSRIAAAAAVYDYFGGWLVYFIAAATALRIVWDRAEACE